MRGRRAAGFSLVEVVVASLILSGLFVAALTAVGATRAGQVATAQRAEAEVLAAELMAEALAQDFGGDTLGPEAGESAAGTRDFFDDLDDYDGYTESPPRLRNGGATGLGDGYARGVEVRWVAADRPDVVSATPTGVKRITVTASVRGRPLAKLVALRTAAAPAANAMVEAPLR